MQAPAALIIFVLAVAPIVCAVDYAFYRKAARHKPKSLWLGAFVLPWVMLVSAAAWARVLFPVALLLALAVSVAWTIRRWRIR
jgi:hypothetical protein